MASLVPGSMAELVPQGASIPGPSNGQRPEHGLTQTRDPAGDLAPYELSLSAQAGT